MPVCGSFWIDDGLLLLVVLIFREDCSKYCAILVHNLLILLMSCVDVKILVWVQRFMLVFYNELRF